MTAHTRKDPPPPPPVDNALPSQTIPLRTFRPVVTKSEVDLTISRALALPQHWKHWIMRRINTYDATVGSAWTGPEIEYAACSDFFRYAKTQPR